MQDNKYPKKQDTRFTRNRSEDISNMLYGKIPPQSRDLECAVLGAILIEKDAINDVAGFLTPKVFYVDAHAMIYENIVNLFVKNAPIDLLTITEELRKNGKLEEVGGMYYVSELTNKVASSANVEYHARIVFQKFIQRELIRISNGIIQDSYEDTTDVFDLLDKAEKHISDITQSINGGAVEHISAVGLKAITNMKNVRDNGVQETGISSGIKELDEIIHSMNNSDLIIIGGGPGEGKTTLGLQIAKYAAEMNEGAIFSLEMSKEQLYYKFLSDELECETEKIMRGELTPEQWIKFEEITYDFLNSLKLFMYDIAGLSIFSLISICRGLKAKKNIKWILIDYLQLLNASRGEDGGGVGNREQEISFISRKLKELAKELNIPVIALAQVSRLEKGSAKRLYALSDLRESGGIEQNADMVMFVWRPSYHRVTSMLVDGDMRTFDYKATIIQVLKRRMGRTGNAFVDFNKEFSRFESSPEVYMDMAPIVKGTKHKQAKIDIGQSNGGTIIDDLDGDMPF